MTILNPLWDISLLLLPPKKTLSLYQKVILWPTQPEGKMEKVTHSFLALAFRNGLRNL